jgi:predicted permease
MQWLRRFVRRRHADADLHAEINFHLQEEVRLRVERGETPGHARLGAHRLFGNLAMVQEDARGMWAWASLVSTWRSFFLVVRSFAHAWGFAVAAILTVALGIGANTMAFSMFDHVLFRPLPYADPDRLVQIQTRDWSAAVNGPDGATVNEPITHALAEEKGLFTGIAWASGGNWTSGGARPMTPVAGENPELWLTSVSWNTLDVLGIRPVIGAGFSATAIADAALPVLLTYETWQERYHGSDNVLSLSWTAPLVTTSGDTRWRVVGVLPKGFLLPTSRPVRGEFDGIVGVDPGLEGPGRTQYIMVAPFARLAPGVSLASARARANTIAALAFGKTNVTIEPLQTGIGVAVRPYVWLAVAGAWTVLGATCLTLAILLLTWSHSRRHAGSVRLALGASPRRLVLTAALESALLCAAGAVVGWLGYLWTRSLFMEALPLGLRSFAADSVDVRVIVATCGTAMVSAVVAGTLPAIRSSRVTPLDVMRPPRNAGILDRLEQGPVLLGTQAAVGALLLVGAMSTAPAVIGALLQSQGFDASDLFIVGIPTSDDETAENALEQVRRGFTAMDVLRRLPGVVDVTLSTGDPFQMAALDHIGSRRHVPGFDGRVLAVDAGFFHTLRTRIVAGRPFSVGDIQQQALVAIVNESAARRFWPGLPTAGAIGRTVATFDGPAVVVGVVVDIRRELDIRADPVLFLPLSAKEFYRSVNGFHWHSFNAFVRMVPGRVLDRFLVGKALQREPWALPNMSALLWESVTSALEPAIEKPRLLAAVFGTLGTIVLVLTTFAVYGLASFEVRRRRGEMTIRLALGATPRMLRRRLATVIVTPVLIGVLVSLPFSWVEVKLLSLSIPQVHANDVRVYAGATAAMFVAALVAAWLPGRRLFRMRAAELLRPM